MRIEEEKEPMTRETAEEAIIKVCSIGQDSGYQTNGSIDHTNIQHLTIIEGDVMEENNVKEVTKRNTITEQKPIKIGEESGFEVIYEGRETKKEEKRRQKQTVV